MGKTDAPQRDIRIKFWGTRGSIPTPGKYFIKYGGNTPCVEVRCGETILIFSQPNNQKIHNLRANPAVTLALEAANEGEDVAILEGTARLVSPDDIQASVPAYVAKYEAGMAELGMTWETMSASYSQPIRVTPSRLITW